MMRKLSVCATKGGVGKTTLTANLGAIIVDAGYRVLLIDADPQPSLSSYYAVNQSPDSTGLTDLLTSDRRPVPARTSVENLDIIVSDDPTGSLETQLLYAADGRLRMHTGLQRIDGYDFALIDTRGSAGVIVESAALAADICLSPIPPEVMAAQEFVRGTVSMLSGLQSMSAFGIAPGVLCALIYRYDRTNDTRNVSESIAAAADISNARLLLTSVPNRVAFREAATLQVPVHRQERTRRNSASARQIMEALRSEIFDIFSSLEK